MANRQIEVAVVLSAYDRLTSVINRALGNAQTRLTNFQNQSNRIADKALGVGTGGLAAGAGAAALLYKPIKAFAELEDAGLRMKALLMQDGGKVPESVFKKLNDQAIVLGNKLPGTTADFQNLYSTMLEQGTPANAILNGTGKAAAYLAVALKLPAEQVGVFASRMRLQMGIADKEMMQFMDVINRSHNIGIDTTEMQYALGRSAGAMKLLNVQGLEASKSLTAVFSILLRQSGQTGETAGGGMAKIMNELMNPTKVAKFNAAARQYGLGFEFFRKGKFLGIENFVAQFGQLRKLDPRTINKILTGLTGGDGSDNAILASLIKAGPAGYNAVVKEMASHATLDQQVDVILNSLTNKWESATGTLTNAMAAFGGTFAPLLKKFADYLNTGSAALQTMIEKHHTLFKWIGYGIMLFSSIASTVGVFALAVYGGAKFLSMVSGSFSTLIKFIRIARFGFFALRYTLVTAVWPALVSAATAVWGFTTALLANPVTWIVVGIVALAAAAYLIYKNWKPISAWFSNQWVIIKAQLNGALEVGKLLWGVFEGLGKVIIGAFTFDPAMVMSGMHQVTATASKIMNGGISAAYTKGYSSVMDANSAAASLPNSILTNRPKIQPKSNAATSVFQAPITINLSGASKGDAQHIAHHLEHHIKKALHEHLHNQNRVSYAR